jgi:DNA primase
MAGIIPQELLDDILNKIDIVEVISGYIPLKRAGRNFRALCPFHQEKTPSFMVSPDRQIYHCFGCNSGGNSFNFLMKYERLEFPEAVEILAKKAGVRLPDNKQDFQTTSVNQQIYKIMDLAAAFYQSTLSSASGAQAKNYLFKRDIKEEAIKLFRLGFATDKWESLINYLRAKNASLSLMEKAGLVITKQGGGYYDRFRNRVIFPILDIKSRTIGFGGRLLPGLAGSKDDDLAKYINSPETPIYIKGRNLYNLNNAKDAIRESDFVVIVEGYLDCILPFQEGLQNIVASLGTALTYEQVRLLKRYTHNAVMVYDADAAGEMATLRSLDIFVEEGVTVRVAALPAGFDPDLFVRKNGIESFKKLIQSSQNLFDYKLNILKSRYNHHQIEGRALIAQEMLVTIKKFNNAILKSDYIRKLSEELDIKEEALVLELGKIKDYRPPGTGLAETQKKPVRINPTEKLLIKLMVEEADILNKLKDCLEPADFQDERTAKIVSIMFDLLSQGKAINPSNLINYLEPHQDLSGIISEVTLSPDTSDDDRGRIADDCVRRLKKQRLRMKREYLHREIKNAQNLRDEELLKRLMQEFHCLMKSAKEPSLVKGKEDTGDNNIGEDR